MNSKEYIESIKEILTETGSTISIAESVTGGYIQSAFSDAKDATVFFQGGITVYNLGQKTKHLGIDPIKGEKYNCVSEDIAVQMAKGSVKLFNSDVAISITGYASPVPEEGIDSIYAYGAVVVKELTIGSFELTSKQKEPEKVKKDYCGQMIERTFKLLKYHYKNQPGNKQN